MLNSVLSRSSTPSRRSARLITRRCSRSSRARLRRAKNHLILKKPRLKTRWHVHLPSEMTSKRKLRLTMRNISKELKAFKPSRRKRLIPRRHRSKKSSQALQTAEKKSLRRPSRPLLRVPSRRCQVLKSLNRNSEELRILPHFLQ